MLINTIIMPNKPQYTVIKIQWVSHMDKCKDIDKQHIYHMYTMDLLTIGNNHCSLDVIYGNISLKRS